MNLIVNTTTRSGLQIRAEADRGQYEKGVEVTDAELKAVKLTPSKFHGEWNYVISPRSAA